MALTIFISSTLRKYMPDYDPMTGFGFDVKGGMTVLELCEHIGIPTQEIKMVMVNGIRQNLSYELAGDERVSIFPPVGGG
jgi:molybdopterin converting factor small subunit